MASSYGNGNACNAYFDLISDEIQKLNKKLSISAVTKIMKYHNPLKVMNATQLARKINLDNEMRNPHCNVRTISISIKLHLS